MQILDSSYKLFEKPQRLPLSFFTEGCPYCTLHNSISNWQFYRRRRWKIVIVARKIACRLLWEYLCFRLGLCDLNWCLLKLMPTALRDKFAVTPNKHPESYDERANNHSVSTTLRFRRLESSHSLRLRQPLIRDCKQLFKVLSCISKCHQHTFLHLIDNERLQFGVGFSYIFSRSCQVWLIAPSFFPNVSTSSV